jgi:hypothetical protein
VDVPFFSTGSATPVEVLVMPWRRLAKDEIIQAGDEIDRCSNPWKDDAQWEPVHHANIGKPAPDPQYPSHSQYRRLTPDRCPPHYCDNQGVCHYCGVLMEPDWALNQ